jgi:arabinofuranan 3-O-arabinosyltransferase
MLIGRTTCAFEDKVFTEWRILFCGIGIVLCCAMLLAWKIGQGQTVIDTGGAAQCRIDFCTSWVSGVLVAAGQGVKAYDYPFFSAAQLDLVGPPAPGFPASNYAYPPIFLFFTYPLGLLPYPTAFVTWTIATLILYVAAVYVIIPRSTAVVSALTPVAVAQSILLGQNGLLTAGLMGLALALLRFRPYLAGAVISLLTYKPQFGVVFPLALLASRQWQAFAAATVGSLLLIGATIAVFGSRSWIYFFEYLGHRNSSLGVDQGVELTHQSLFGLLHWIAGGDTMPLLLHVIVAIGASIAVTLVCRWPTPHDLKAAAICLGSVVVTPYIEVYDLCVLPIGAAFLIRDGLMRGFLPAERALMLLCLGVMSFLYLPIGPLIYGVLLLLLARRVFASERVLTTPPASLQVQVAGEDFRMSHALIAQADR